MTDIDELLRGFRSTLDEPPPGALARARSRALAGRAASVRSRPRWLAIPATAVAVAAVAVTTSLVLGQSPPPVTGPTAAPATSGMSTGDPTTPAPPTTAELIEAWARDLETGPLPPPAAPGQLLLPSYRVFSDGQWTEQPAGHITIERDGLLVVDNAEFGYRASFQAYVAQQRAEFAHMGPSWRYPTAEWLEALDPSPASLRQACGDECYTDWSIWARISDDLLARGEIVVPPRVRAGLLRLLGTLKGVTAYEDTVDGRPVRVVSLPDTFDVRPGLTLSYSRAELYIDPALNRFVGSGVLQTGRSPDLPQCHQNGVIDVTATPRPGPPGDECFEVIPVDPPERVSITLWEQTVVTP